MESNKNFAIAKFPRNCRRCGQIITVGTVTVRRNARFVHLDCVAAKKTRMTAVQVAAARANAYWEALYAKVGRRN